MKNPLHPVKFICLVAFSFLTINAFSQNGGARAGQAKANLQEKRDSLKLVLKLSDTQSKQFDEITAKHRNEARQKAQSLPADASPKEKRDIMKTAMENADAEIMAILTPEQQKIFKQEKEKMKAQMQSKAKEKRGKKP